MAANIRIECDGHDVFVVVDGKRIAKRGHPGSPHAMTWTSLEPGWSVISPADHSSISIVYKGERVQ